MIKILLVLMVLISVALLYSSKIPLRINTSSSMPMGLYYEMHRDLTRGDWVEVCLPKAIAVSGLLHGYLHRGQCPNGVNPVIKEIAAINGDEIELTQDAMIVNHRMLPMSATQSVDQHGQRLVAVTRGHYKVHPGQIWLYGNHSAYSWDSRYYGAIDQSTVVALLQPLFIQESH